MNSGNKYGVVKGRRTITGDPNTLINLQIHHELTLDEGRNRSQHSKKMKNFGKKSMELTSNSFLKTKNMKSDQFQSASFFNKSQKMKNNSMIGKNLLFDKLGSTDPSPANAFSKNTKKIIVPLEL